MGDEAPAGHFSTQPFKPVFLSSPGRPPIPWDRWRAMFEDWLLAIGFPAGGAMEQRKAALLRASLGIEGFRVYVSLTSEPRESYENAVEKLSSHFAHPASAIFSRAQFTRRQQRPGESVTSYVAVLRELAAKCDFPADQLNERVRDQFAAWCCVDRIRERLLQEPATRSLEELLTLAVTIERAMSEAPALVESDRAVNRIGAAPANRGRKPSYSSSSTACTNCGATGHVARSSDCPARDRTCRACGRVGHYASCCRSSQPSSQPPHPSHPLSRRRHRSLSRRRAARTNQVNDSPSSADCNIDAVEVVNSVNIGSGQINAVCAFKQIRCRLADVETDLILDLGAKVSILAHSFYKQPSLASFPLQPADVTLHAYNGQRIE